MPKFTITENHKIADKVYRMVLRGDTGTFSAPGQFVEIELPGKFLRRPISVCDLEDDILTLIYKEVGKGTRQMSAMLPGTQLDLLTGLGHGFSLPDGVVHPVLVGGGVGAPPLFLLARKWMEKGVSPKVVLGFNTVGEVFLADGFRSLGLEVSLCTVDGSAGIKGFVTDAPAIRSAETDFIQSCGPMPMLRALATATDCRGEWSLEERMGCGFGICMGCSVHTSAGPARVCTEGPVFDRQLIDFNVL